MSGEKRPVFKINPPPDDRKCEVCHKHVSELKPFGGKGDPLVGDFKGYILLKTFRPMAPRGQDKWNLKGMMIKGKKLTKAEEKELEKLRKKVEVEIHKGIYQMNTGLISEEENERKNELDNKKSNSYSHIDEEKFIKKYGKKGLEEFYFYDQLINTVEASWECRDCIVLDSDKEYFRMKNES